MDLYYMHICEYRGFSRGIKRSERDVDHPSPSSARVRTVQLYLHTPLCRIARRRKDFSFIDICTKTQIVILRCIVSYVDVIRYNI
jgi:hypothetical protein